MRGLVVYYSRSGTTKKVGEAIASLLDFDKELLLDVKSRKGALGYIRSGREASLKKLAEIKKLKKNPNDYDLIIVGTPIWGWNISSPIRTYVTANKNEFKKVAFFCTQGGSGAERAFREMKKIIGKKAVAVLALKTKDVMNKNYMNKVNEFVNKIK